MGRFVRLPPPPPPPPAPAALLAAAEESEEVMMGFDFTVPTNLLELERDGVSFFADIIVLVLLLLMKCKSFCKMLR